MSNKSTASAITSGGIFGLPPVLDGEDMAAYDELCSRFSAAIKPADVADEMYLNDVTSLEWEVLRWRRLKLKLFQRLRLRAIGSFLAMHIDYHLYGEKKLQKPSRRSCE